jgi:hypothetical protein
MNITVKIITLGYQIVPLQVNTNDTILTVQNEIKKVTGVEVDEYEGLAFFPKGSNSKNYDAHYMPMTQTLQHFNVQDGDSLHMFGGLE